MEDKTDGKVLSGERGEGAARQAEILNRRCDGLQGGGLSSSMSQRPAAYATTAETAAGASAIGRGRR